MSSRANISREMVSTSHSVHAHVPPILPDNPKEEEISGSPSQKYSCCGQPGRRGIGCDHQVVAFRVSEPPLGQPVPEWIERGFRITLDATLFATGWLIAYLLT